MRQQHHKREMPRYQSLIYEFLLLGDKSLFWVARGKILGRDSTSPASAALGSAAGVMLLTSSIEGEMSKLSKSETRFMNYYYYCSN